jgi:tight adherence protein C
VLDAPNRGAAGVTGVVISTIPVQSTIGPGAVALLAVVIGSVARARVTRPTRLSLGALPRRSNSALASPHARRAMSIIGAVAVTWIVGPFAFAVAVAAVWLLRRLRPVLTDHRRRAAIERALPDAMDQLVAMVRAGLTPFQAVSEIARTAEPSISDAFREVVRRTERGQPFADALTALPQHLGTVAGELADVIAASDRHGLPLGPVLDQLTAETRATRRRLDQADTRKLPVRLAFPLVMCTLPSFVLLAIAPALIAALSSLGASAW